MVSAASLSARQVNGVRARQPVRPTTRTRAPHPGPRAVSPCNASVGFPGFVDVARRTAASSRGSDRGDTSRGATSPNTHRQRSRHALFARRVSRVTLRGARPRGARSAFFSPSTSHLRFIHFSISPTPQVRAPVRAAFAVRAEAVRATRPSIRYSRNASTQKLASSAPHARSARRVPNQAPREAVDVSTPCIHSPLPVRRCVSKLVFFLKNRTLRADRRNSSFLFGSFP